MTPDISVIVPHLDQRDLLEKCLASLVQQDVSGMSVEIILADNGTPGGVESLRGLSDLIRVVHAEERGAAPARNKAIEISRGRFLAFIDADCIAAPGWLQEGISSLQHADISGGEVKVTVADPAQPRPVESFERVFAFNQRRYIGKLGFSVTANIITTREVVRSVGLFRNGVSEDLDWCRRAAALGFRLVFNDKSIVSHPARMNYKSLASKWDRLLREKFATIKSEQKQPRLRFCLLAVATAGSIFPHLCVVAVTRRLTTFRERIGAGMVLVKIRLWRSWRMFQVAFAPR